MPDLPLSALPNLHDVPPNPEDFQQALRLVSPDEAQEFGDALYDHYMQVMVEYAAEINAREGQEMRSSPTPNEAPHGDAVVNDITIDDPELPPAASVPPTPSPPRMKTPTSVDVGSPASAQQALSDADAHGEPDDEAPAPESPIGGQGQKARVTWDADYVSSGEDLPRTISPVRKTILRPFKVNGPVRKTSIIATSADSVQKRFDGVEVPHLKGWSADDIRRLEGKGRRIDEDDDIEESKQTDEDEYLEIIESEGSPSDYERDHLISTPGKPRPTAKRNPSERVIGKTVATGTVPKGRITRSKGPVDVDISNDPDTVQPGAKVLPRQIKREKASKPTTASTGKRGVPTPLTDDDEVKEAHIIFARDESWAIETEANACQPCKNVGATCRRRVGLRTPGACLSCATNRKKCLSSSGSALAKMEELLTASTASVKTNMTNMVDLVIKNASDIASIRAEVEGMAEQLMDMDVRELQPLYDTVGRLEENVGAVEKALGQEGEPHDGDRSNSEPEKTPSPSDDGHEERLNKRRKLA